MCYHCHHPLPNDLFSSPKSLTAVRCHRSSPEGYTGESVVEFSPALRETRVRFPAHGPLPSIPPHPTTPKKSSLLQRSRVCSGSNPVPTWEQPSPRLAVRATIALKEEEEDVQVTSACWELGHRTGTSGQRAQCENRVSWM